MKRISVHDAIGETLCHDMTAIRADGGPTRDIFLMQFQADILNIPIEISQTEELSGMGAAFCAAIGLGLTSGESLKQTRRIIAPNMHADKREALYSGWKKAVQIIERGSSI